MPDIFHDFPIAAPIDRVFENVSTPRGLDRWWTQSCQGEPGENAVYRFGFGPGYDWRGVVTAFAPGREIEWRVSEAEPDWQGTQVGFELSEQNGKTQVQFHHTGWPEDNEHYRGSCYCWAMYLRVLRRHVEHGENVPYEKRLDV